MAQCLENVLKYDRASGRKSGLEKLRAFFAAAAGVHPKERDAADCSSEETKPWEEDMKEKLGGYWW